MVGNNRANQVTLRLSAKGKEEILGTFRDMGGEYKKLANQIERDSRKPTAGLKAINAGSREAQAGIKGLSSSAGPLGRVLSDIGPVGLSAGAALGAFALAAGAALAASRSAVVGIASIGEQAAILQVSTDAFQALELQAEMTGVGFAQVQSAVNGLNERIAEASTGQGELFNRLQATNPELLEQLTLARTNDERLQLLSKALRGAKNETDANRIAVAAFGGAGIGMVRVLGDAEDGLNGLIASASEAGGVIDQDLVAKAEEMNASLAVAAQVIDRQLKEAFIRLGPILVEAAEFTARVATAFNDLLDALDTSPTEQFEQDVEFYGSQVERFTGLTDEATAALARLRAGEEAGLSGDLAGFLRDQIRPLFGATISDAEALEKAITRLGKAATDNKRSLLDTFVRNDQAIPDDLAKEFDVGAGQFLPPPPPAPPPGAKTPAELAAEARAQAVALRERNKLEQEAIKLRAELGDFTASLSAQVSEYQALLGAGLITQAQYDEAVRRATEALDGTAEAVKVWTDLVQGSLTPTEQARAQLVRLEQDWTAGHISLDLYNASLEQLAKKLNEAEEAARKADPRIQAADGVRDESERLRQSGLSNADKLAEETARIQSLIGGPGGLTQTEADDFLARYAKQLEGATQATQRFGAEQQILNGVMNGQIRTLGDLAGAIGDVILQYLQAQIAGQGSFGGGGGQGLIGGLIGGITGLFHDGGTGGSRPRRFRSGPPMANERLAMIRRDERVIRPDEQVDFSRALQQLAAATGTLASVRSDPVMVPRGGALGVSVNIENVLMPGQTAEVTQSRDEQGNVNIRQVIREVVGDEIAAGHMDGALASRPGARRRGA